MATLNIEGRTVQVDDSFLKLPPDQQNATVDEIARSLKATPAAQEQAKTEPPPQRGLMSAITDIPGEVKAAAGEAIYNITAVRNRGQQGPIEGLMTTGKALLGVPQLAFSPITGAARAVGGNLMAQAEHGIGSMINPEVAARDNLDQMYATAKGDVDTAMLAAKPGKIAGPSSRLVNVAGKRLEEAGIAAAPEPAIAGQRVAYVDPKMIDAEWAKNPNFYLDKGAASSGMTNRYVRAKDFLANSDTFKASELKVDEAGRVFFDDGRHRFAVLRDSNAGPVPVSMDEVSLRNAADAGYVVNDIRQANPVSPGQEVSAAAARLSETGSPVQVPRAVTSDSMPVQQAASVASNVPIAGDPLVKAADRTLKQLGQKATEVAGGYGEATTPAAAGDAARESIRNWITGKSAETSRKFYAQVDAAVDPAVRTDLAETRQAAQSILDRRKNAGILDQSGAVRRIEEAVTNPKGLNFAGIKDLRGYVRELMDNPSLLPSDISQGELKSIYGALTNDLRQSALAAGGERAVTAFERANRHYALLSNRREALAKIIGANGDTPAERVFDRLVTMASSKAGGDIAKLSQARKAMGAEGWNEFAGGVVAQLGRDAEGQFSPQRFITAYGKLSPAGKGLLFRSGGNENLALHLDDIAKVSSRFKELQKFANPSGTGRTVLGGSIGTGLIMEPLTTITSVLGGRLVAEVLSRPAGAASVAKVARAQETLVRAPSQRNLTSYGIAARNLISTSGANGVGVSDFIKALQGAASAPAGPEGAAPEGADNEQP